MSFSVVMRIFSTRTDAERAKELLEKGGFRSGIKEDKFGELSLKELDIPPRFRLYVDSDDYFKIAEYLAKKLPKRL